MRLPRKLFGNGEQKDRQTLLDMNHVTNMIWQSERKTFEDCELITEQIIMYLFKEGYLKARDG